MTIGKKEKNFNIGEGSIRLREKAKTISALKAKRERERGERSCSALNTKQQCWNSGILQECPIINYRYAVSTENKNGSLGVFSTKGSLSL